MERENLQEIWRKMTKNLCGALLSRRERERKRFEKFLKKCFEQVKSIFFFKPYSRVSIDRKSVLIDQNGQRLTKNFKCNFD